MRLIVICKALDRPESFILKGLHERGETVTVLLTHENQHSQMLGSCGIRIAPFPLRSRLDFLGALRLRSFVRKNGADVVYALSNAAISAANLGLVGTRIPIVAYRGTIGNLSAWDPSSWLTFLNPNISKIVCVSQATERDLHRVGLPRNRTVTIYKGHDVDWYSVPPPCSRESIGIPSGAFVVGCTAAIRAGKGVGDLLEACKSLLSEVPSLHLLLIGSIDDDALTAAIASFPEPHRIHMTGFRADAPQLATLCDVTVLASKRREGFPKSVVEAMSQGVPPIVTSVGGMPELVAHGEAGIVVPPSDPEALAGAIRALAQNEPLRLALGAAAKARIKTKFGVERSIALMQKLFQALAAESFRSSANTELLSAATR